MTNPYQSPQSAISEEETDVHYAGFWIRVACHVIDSIIFMAITLPILLSLYGKEMFDPNSFFLSTADILVNYVLPAVAVILFWIYKSATPGKMVLGITIVDARTGGKPSPVQFIIRYIGYFVATIPLFIGLIWVAFDARKQGWHDKLARTVVIQKR